MDSFDNFQYDSASSYGGGMGIVDDNSSVYTANTNSKTDTLDLENLSLADPLERLAVSNGNGHNHLHSHAIQGQEEDYEGVLDDLKDESVVDLPPHACRLALLVMFNDRLR